MEGLRYKPIAKGSKPTHISGIHHHPHNYASNVLGHRVLVAGYYADKSKKSNRSVVACSSVHWKYGRGNRTRISCELAFDTKDSGVFHLVKFTDDTSILRLVDLSNSGAGMGVCDQC